MTDYQPGVCNIGKAEVQRRKSKLYIALALLMLTSVLYLFYSEHLFLFALQIGIACYASILFFQVRQKFCIAYGWLSLFNFGELSDKKKRVVNEEWRRQDLLQVAKIMGLSLLTTLVYIACIFLLKRIF